MPTAYAESFSSSRLSGRWSKALLKSSNVAPMVLFKSASVFRSSVSLSRVVQQLWFFQ